MAAFSLLVGISPHCLAFMAEAVGDDQRAPAWEKGEGRKAGRDLRPSSACRPVGGCHPGMRGEKNIMPAISPPPPPLPSLSPPAYLSLPASLKDEEPPTPAKEEGRKKTETEENKQNRKMGGYVHLHTSSMPVHSTVFMILLSRMATTGWGSGRRRPKRKRKEETEEGKRQQQ